MHKQLVVLLHCYQSVRLLPQYHIVKHPLQVLGVWRGHSELKPELKITSFNPPEKLVHMNHSKTI